MNDITVILNVYKRPDYLEEQIKAIQNQTIPPKEIMIWYNKPEDQPQMDLDYLGVKVVYANHNFKFHGRFALGLLARTEYVAFFDDDTIPGNRWFENCMNYKDENVILGTAGVLLQTDNRYNPHQKVGWNGIQSDTPTEVDLVGHAWFLHREHLKYLWQEYPISWENGEDIQLSAFAHIHSGVRTIVPPHPKDKSYWGSINGMKYGNDDNASWKISNHSSLRDEIVNGVIKKGYIPVKNRL